MPTNQQLFRFLGSERATHLILLKFLAQRIALLFLRVPSSVILLRFRADHREEEFRADP